MTPDSPLAGLELGGTRCRAAIGTGPDDLELFEEVPTTTPQETLGRIRDLLEPRSEELTAVGIASFGPLDLDPESAGYGSITQTPKAHWSNTPLKALFEGFFGLPVGIQTDVSASALGEYTWGAGRGCDPLIYLTVGTGVGGGAIVRGSPLTGLLHPEMGHMRVRRHPEDEHLQGTCPFHGDCLEGLASGLSLARRWGIPAEELGDDHEAWERQAWYLAQAIVSITTIISPRRVVLGGGVGSRDILHRLTRDKLVELLGGYLDSPVLTERPEEYLVPPGLGERSGVCGALVLARSALESS